MYSLSHGFANLRRSTATIESLAATVKIYCQQHLSSHWV